MDAGLIVSGALVGFLVGLTGVGGGALMTPLLVTVFHQPLSVAIGTDIVFAALTKGLGGAIHARLGTVDWRIVGWLAAGSVPATIASMLWLSKLNPETSSQILMPLFGAALVITALSLFWRPRIRSDVGSASVMRLRYYLTFLCGIVLGVMITLTSIGAGALGMVLLRWLYPDVRIAVLVGSDIVHALLVATIAGWGHFQMGNVDTSILFLLLVGSIPGVWLGSRLCAYCPDRVARPLLGVMLFVVGVRFL